MYQSVDTFYFARDQMYQGIDTFYFADD